MLNNKTMYDPLVLEYVWNEMFDAISFEDREEAENWFEFDFRAAFETILDEVFGTGGGE